MQPAGGLGYALEAVSDPWVLAGMVVQFLLGVGLGYVSAKALKYILAFIALLLLSALINGYTLGGSLTAVMEKYYQEAAQLSPHVKEMLAAVGLLTLGPLSIGFLVGAAIGLVKK